MQKVCALKTRNETSAYSRPVGTINAVLSAALSLDSLEVISHVKRIVQDGLGRSNNVESILPLIAPAAVC